MENSKYNLIRLAKVPINSI